MCGLVAAFARNGAAIPTEAIEKVAARMARRGPEGEELWQAILAHRRLAVIDLDSRSAQPMQSSCGRYRIVFNGEIYNFRDLRRDLERRGHVFRTTADTEVLLALFAAEGQDMLTKLHGMFAFVIWDSVTRRGFAARDAYGIKPLYIARVPGGVVLAAQVTALLASGLVSRAPCARGQAGFWMLGSVSEPFTWFRDIRPIGAGHFAWIEDGAVVREAQWSDVGAAWREAEHGQFAHAEETPQRVHAALRESIARHLVADVPVGVFLSGGVDSGTLAALMIELGHTGVEGVTLAYDEFAGGREDEASSAAVLASRFGIRHTISHVTAREFNADLPRILAAMDQPTIDGVNTWYASRGVAQRSLKVVLSGRGGGELFQGYSHFQSLPLLTALRRHTALVPGTAAVIEQTGRWLAQRTGNQRWSKLETWTRTIEAAWWLRRSIHTPDELSSLMGEDLAHEALAEVDPVAQVRAMAGELPRDPRLAIGQMESTIYLRNQLLRDSDWASIELRTPLVDSHLLQQMQPMLGRFNRYRRKSLLARAPASELPVEIRHRKKTGFGIPVSRWMQGRDAPLSTVWAPHVAAAYQEAA